VVPVQVLSFLFVPGTRAIVTAVIGGGAVVTEATAGVLTGGPLLRRGLRQFAIGVAAAAMTCEFARVFATVVG
jgi:VIT1/CCC1 family predicted Fe2+/Mn2+ transporter